MSREDLAPVGDGSASTTAQGSSALDEALQRAYGHLRRRERTVAEVRAHLGREDVAAELVEQALSELVEQGYLDDARYARCFAEDRRNLDSWGTERIRRRLHELGIERELAESAAAPIEDGQELAAAVELLRRRVRDTPADPRARSRALGLLVRRGYGEDVAYEAVRRFAGEPG